MAVVGILLINGLNHRMEGDRMYRILELNPEHEAVKAMQSAMVGDTQKAKDYAQLLYGQALLMADLPLEDPAEFGKLVCKLMK